MYPFISYPTPLPPQNSVVYKRNIMRLHRTLAECIGLVLFIRNNIVKGGGEVQMIGKWKNHASVPRLLAGIESCCTFNGLRGITFCFLRLTLLHSGRTREFYMRETTKKVYLISLEYRLIAISAEESCRKSKNLLSWIHWSQNKDWIEHRMF